MTTQRFSKEGVAKLIREKNVELINLCHIPEDCRLKTLSFSVRSAEKLYEILRFGERVDGSSLFSYIDPNKSDIYIMPKIETAFLDPFTQGQPTLNILCDYLNENGKPLEIAPQNILRRAEEKLKSSTNIMLKALAELEFHICNQEETAFPVGTERNYHESAPFAKFTNLRSEILGTLEDIGIATKYGHAEVGRFYAKHGYLMEQHEIELLPQSLSKMAEIITIAKWVIRNVCTKHGVFVSFSPKPSLKHAGNGMHIHLCGLRENENIVADSAGNVTTAAKQMIGGILKFAPSLTAFGNTIPVSYLRFISRKESPMFVCWGGKNRQALVRIPLWWSFRKDFEEANSCRRTFEFRAPDPSANPYLLFAGIAVAVEYGLKHPKEVMKIAKDLNVDYKSEKTKEYPNLPLSCVEAAQSLKTDRKYYMESGVFPERVIDGIIDKFNSYKDGKLWEKLAEKPERIDDFLVEYFDYG